MAEKTNVLITGAGRGIGREIALAFAREGANLILSSRSDKELAETAKLANQAGSKCAVAVNADLGDRKPLLNLAERVGKEFKTLDVLVNNAGYLKVEPFSETSLETWDQTLAVNLTAPFLLTQKLLPLLRKSKNAHVFNVLSMASRVAFPGSSAYCSSKAGLLGFNGVLREELRELGIRVTAVLPGATDTKMFDAIPGEFDRNEFVQPQDVASAIANAYKMSPNSNVDEIQITPKRFK